MTKENIVELHDVTKIYRQGTIDVHALNGVDLTIPTGNFAAVSGPSGSGKTTLFNMIGGLDRPSTGTVVVEGQDLSVLSQSALAKLRLFKVGFVFQAYNLVPVLTAYENAELVLAMQGMPPAERRKRVTKILTEVGLKDMMHRRPYEMSGGQQQRVAVARAVVAHPTIVLADEPTANLDSKTGGALLDMMRSLNDHHGTTFLLATHDPMVMERASRVIHMVDGAIANDTRKD